MTVESERQRLFEEYDIDYARDARIMRGGRDDVPHTDKPPRNNRVFEAVSRGSAPKTRPVKSPRWGDKPPGGVIEDAESP